MALSDYQQIEYIEGVSGAYIDSGQAFTRYRLVSARFNFKTLDTVKYIYGVDDGTRRFNFRYSDSDSAYIWNFGNRSATQPANLTPLYNADTDLDMTQQQTASNRYTVYLTDGNTTLSSYCSIPTSATNATINTFIMARNNSGSATGYAVGSRLYEIRIFDPRNDTETDVFHGIPIREKTGLTPKVGLYDLVTDAPFWSATATNFVAGPDIGGGGTQIYVKVNGTWVLGDPYIKVNGNWEPAENVFIKTGGNWEPAA